MWLVHAIAKCDDCGKEWESRNAQDVAAQHAKRYGHSVHGELGYAFAFPAPRPTTKRKGE